MELLLGESLSTFTGLYLTQMWRFAGHQVFEFGPEVPEAKAEKLPTTPRDRTLTTAVTWLLEGPDGFSLGDEHFGSGDMRRDEHAHSFYDRIFSEPMSVVNSHVGPEGQIRLELSRGYSISITPMDQLDPWEEQWSLRRSATDSVGTLALGPAGLIRYAKGVTEPGESLG